MNVGEFLKYVNSRKPIPANVFAGGVPAKVIKKI